MSVVLASLAKAAEKLLSKAMDDLYALAKDEAKNVVAQWRATNQLSEIAQRIESVGLVQRIANPAAVPLSDFYFPSRIVIKGSTQGKTISCVNDISDKQNILITGTVGQGKSVFMRYLCLSQLKQPQGVPIFAELKDLDEKTSVERLITLRLETLGMKAVTPAVLHFMLEHGVFIFFLDGYDEVKRDFAYPAQQELQVLMSRYQKTRWVISSRPGGLGDQLSRIPGISSVELAKLDDADFQPFLEALKIPKAQRAKLGDAIDNCPSQVRQVLHTPLMLTLLALTFGTSAHIPDTLHEFYEQMFHVLVSRHDETKCLFHRERVTKLNNGELQEVFSYFCYLSKDFGVSLTDQQFSECSKRAARLTNHSFTPEGLKTDLVDTVCLMTKDGLKTAFIHKSVQEFFSAYFVKTLGEEDRVKALYGSLLQGKFTDFLQELRFLEQIDKYRFIQHYRLPAIHLFLKNLDFGDGDSRLLRKNFDKFMSNLGVQCTLNKSGGVLAMFIIGGPFFTPLVDEYLRSTLQKNTMMGFFPNKETFEDLLKNWPMKRNALHKEMKTHPELRDTYFAKLSEFVEKVLKEKSRLEKTLQERRQSFAELLNL